MAAEHAYRTAGQANPNELSPKLESVDTDQRFHKTGLHLNIHKQSHTLQ
eukprot:SAG31_NODE_1631_length_7698_cov_2.501908_1_plen_48_part_10